MKRGKSQSWRFRCLPVTAIGCVGALLLTQCAPTTHPASGPVYRARASGHGKAASVTLEEEDGESKHHDSGMYAIPAWALYGSGPSLTYNFAARSLLPAGGGAVVGCVGHSYSQESSFEVASFERVGSAMNLVIRHNPTGGRSPDISPIGDGKYLFFGAALPHDLPDGRYTVTCTVVEHDGRSPADSPAPFSCSFFLPVPPPPSQLARLAALSDAALFDEYIAQGEALKGTGSEPSDAGLLAQAAIAYYSTQYENWRQVRDEIALRGTRMGPRLIEQLRREVVRNAGMGDDERLSAIGFAIDLMELLVDIHDGRAAPLIVEILDGFDGKASMKMRHVALQALENLTYVMFVRWSQTPPPLEVALPAPEAAPYPTAFRSEDAAAEFSAIARRYRSWLANEGKDPATWLELARARARQMMASDNPEEIFAAYKFLSPPHFYTYPGPPHDENPEQTLRRLVAVISEIKRKQGAPQSYSWHGKEIAPELGGTIGEWLELAASYGAQARPYAATLIRIGSEFEDDESAMAYLSEIGGEQVIAYLTERLPILRRRLDAAGMGIRDQWRDFDGNPKVGVLLDYQKCRWQIERSTGHTFEKDGDLAAWWNANRDKHQGQWLMDGLPPLAAQADKGDPESQYLIRQILPDLPTVEGEVPWSPPGEGVPEDYRVKSIGPFRVAWLNEHRSQLVYDAENVAFRTRHGPPIAPVRSQRPASTRLS